jgi:hypothetical protein
MRKILPGAFCAARQNLPACAREAGPTLNETRTERKRYFPKEHPLLCHRYRRPRGGTLMDEHDGGLQLAHAANHVREETNRVCRVQTLVLSLSWLSPFAFVPFRCGGRPHCNIGYGPNPSRRGASRQSFLRTLHRPWRKNSLS